MLTDKTTGSTPLSIVAILVAASSLGLWQCGGDGGKADLASGPLQWYSTCGDPVCRGYTPPAGVAACTTEKAGGSCARDGQQCDPVSDCNQLLVCSTSDPKTRAGGCPISRQKYKTDIQYLGDKELGQYADEIRKMKLATYKYKSGGPTHLGFIIEDAEPSVSVDSERGMVELYGYTSMAVAALKQQQQQLATLQQQVSDLQQQLAAAKKRRK